MDLGGLKERLQGIAEGVAAKGGYELVATEIGGTKRSPILRVFIDRADGLTVEHCAEVSREIEEKLDEADIIPTRYVLEVSSPGLERELSKPADFERFAGSLAKLRTDDGLNGPRTFIGRIIGVDGENLMLEDRNARAVSLPLASISKANLKVDLEAEFGRRS